MRRPRRSRIDRGSSEQPYWPSFTDMMSTVTLVVLFIALIAFIQSIYDAYEQNEIRHELAKVTDVKKHISDIIEQRLEENVGKDKIIRGPNNTISVQGDILFEIGSSEISADGRQVLDHLAHAFQLMLEDEEIRDYLYIILIEGHTDHIPYDNWTLSTERALAVLKYLHQTNPVLAQADFAKYFAATGYSEYHPVAAGNDAQALQQNRRISFQIIIDDEVWQEQVFNLLLGDQGNE